MPPCIAFESSRGCLNFDESGAATQDQAAQNLTRNLSRRDVNNSEQFLLHCLLRLPASLRRRRIGARILDPAVENLRLLYFFLSVAGFVGRQAGLSYSLIAEVWAARILCCPLVRRA